MSLKKYENYTREQLVEEYLETRLASIIEFVGVTWHCMPTDVPKDPAYWKTKDQDLHDMHNDIARRYHIKRDDCLWLENIVDSDNFYIMNYKFKPLLDEAIKHLERKEKEIYLNEQ